MRCTRSESTEMWAFGWTRSDDWHNFGERTLHSPVYIRTYERTWYNKKRHEKMIGQFALKLYPIFWVKPGPITRYMSNKDLFLNDKGRKRFFPTDSIRSKSVETISQRRFLPKLFICKRKIHHKGRKWFFLTVSIRSKSVWNDFSEKVFVKIKMIRISI